MKGIFLILLIVLPCLSNGQTDFWQQTSCPRGAVITALSANRSGYVFAGTANGQVYRSTDNGLSWDNLDLGSGTLAISSLGCMGTATVFATSGGPFDYGWIYRSTDDGDHWTQLRQAYGMSLLVSRLDYVFVGEQSGIDRTTDGGQTWTSLGSGLPPYISALEQNSLNDIFCGSWAMASGIVYRSTDNGGSWFGTSPIGTISSISSLLVTQEDHVIAGTYHGVLRSIDTGATWQTTNVPSTQVRSLAKNADNVLYAGTEVGVYGSTDDGQVWEIISSGMTSQDVHAVAITPGGYVFVGTDTSGVFRSYNRTTSVSESGTPPQCSFVLDQNFPNPFNPTTFVRFQLPGVSDVRLVVYDLLGREVAVLVNERKQPGSYEVMFDASGLPSGVYICWLHARQADGWMGPERMQTRTMVLVR